MATLSRTFVVAFIVLLFLLPLPAMAQKTEKAAIGKCSEVIDRAFRFSSGLPAEFRGVEYRVVLRILPSFGMGESQIVLLKQDDSVRMIQFRLPQGATSVSNQCEKTIQRNPDTSVDEILKEVSVEKVERTADKPTADHLSLLSNLAIPTNLSRDLTMDGTVYELWVQTPSNQIYASFSEGAYGGATDSIPIIKWVRVLAVSVNKRPN